MFSDPMFSGRNLWTMVHDIGLSRPTGPLRPRGPRTWPAYPRPLIQADPLSAWLHTP